jgi:hypothetical protein
MRLTRKPVPWTQTAPKAIAIVLILKGASDSGSPLIRFAAKGATRSIGYAGKIHIGVILLIGNALSLMSSIRFAQQLPTYCVDHRIRYKPELVAKEKDV